MTLLPHFDPDRVSMFAHRILSKLDRFSYDLSEDETILNSCEDYDAKSNAIGIYKVPGLSDESIVLLADGLLVVDGSECTRIYFNEIRVVELDESEEKYIADYIVVTMQDSTRFRIRVPGGIGKLRDVYEVFRFLRNVIRG
ncbi:MAG: hypothetical protein ABIQ99_09115 [Thermoflexales bacterium]